MFFFSLNIYQMYYECTDIQMIGVNVNTDRTMILKNLHKKL